MRSMSSTVYSLFLDDVVQQGCDDGLDAESDFVDNDSGILQ